MATGYEPLNKLKPFGQNIWIADGPHIRFYGMPFSTRMTVVRLADGGMWLHSPIRLTDDLLAEIEEIGPIRHIVAPNNIHYASVHEWQAVRPDAVTWAAPGVDKRAARYRVPIRVDRVLTNATGPDWANRIAFRLVTGSSLLSEVVFFHHASRTLIVTDLIENFDPRHLPWYMAWVVKLIGIRTPDGRTPPDIAATFKRSKIDIRGHVDWMLRHEPERVILAHGRCYEANAVPRLKRAFRQLMK
ncbi:DUF4336 domain-containing protein [Pseudooceanicola sp. C21-150M6]|uniref:DUF4336 domain-containing protein n=1 Tax=Pseudooceanicola sp. C21-150M6 TaxID=3434355 RepID=UPI003D7FDAC0